MTSYVETESKGMMGDLILAWDREIIVFEPVLISNGEAAAYADVELFGMPLKNLVRHTSGLYWTADLVLNAAVADARAVVAEPYKFSFSATGGANPTVDTMLRCAVRGPAVINRDKLRLTDPAGTTYTVATLYTALETSRFTIRREPVVSESTYPA